MKQKNILFFLIFFTNVCLSQDDNNLPELIPFYKNGLFGYCNKQQVIIIKFKYTDAEPFKEDYYLLASPDEKVKEFGSNSYATVKLNSKQHRIDKTGKVVYTFKPNDHDNIIDLPYYEKRFDFFKLEDKVGLKNQTDTVLRAKYQDIICFKRYCDPPFIAKLDNLYGIVDYHDKIITEFKYDTIINCSYSNYFSFLPLIKVKQKGIIFFIDLNGIEYKK